MTQPAAVALAYLAAFADRDPDSIAAHVAPGFVNEHASALGEGCVGRDEYRRRLPGFLAAFADLRYEPERLVADGSAVAVAYRMTATTGDGDPIDLSGVMVIDVADGLITRRTDYWDSLTYLHQTGAADSD